MMKQEDKMSKTKLMPFDIEKAKNGAKVVTRNGLPAKIVDYPIKNEDCPILGLVLIEGEEFPLIFTKTGNQYNNSESCYDLFIEEESGNNSKNENKNMKTKLIPFDLAKAKAGAKIVNRDGNSIRIICDDVISGVKGFNLLVLEKVKETERPYLCRKNGKANLNKSKESVGDLFIEEEEEGVTQLKKKKQGEQKPVNNITGFKVISAIKPKFKVGDYIVNDSVNMRGKIVKLTDHSYQFSSGKCIPFEDNMTRLWDVKDAKPGDVLAGEFGAILIFKQIDDMFSFSSYYNIQQKRNYDWLSNYFQPATKKQRKQLFQKMKEEGYKWDPVKKELKKIENEAVTKTETRSSWTLLDAKPGDVLASKDGYDILIFKEINNSMSFSSYYNILQKPNKNWVKNNELFQPATKEQRDFLFRRMKEAGYQWDKEKKELKKIKVGNVKKGVKKRRMTNQELSWWLRDCPEEHREYSIKGVYHIHSSHDYFNGDDFSNNADRKVDDDILIRRNGGEWEEPLINIK